MTDRCTRLTVVLEQATRVDDVETLVNAIKAFRNVATVGVDVQGAMEYAAAMRVRLDMERKLLALIRDVSK